MFKRHGSDHFANIKYGYITLGLSLLYFVAIVLLHKKRAKYVKQIPVYFHVIIWCLFIAGINVHLFGDMPEHLGVFLKRLGRVSYALTTFNLLLTLRPNVVNYLSLIDLHKWMSRIIIVLGIVHLVGFFGKWILEGTPSKALKPLNLIGFLMFLPFVFLLVVSIRYYRRKAYKLFYILHNATILVYFVVINFHARPGVLFLSIINISLLLIQILFKFNVKRVSLNKVTSYGSLDLAVFERPSNYPTSSPGSHMIILLVNWTLWFLPPHPFTVINYHEHLNLIISNTNKFHFDPSRTYSITFPYSSNLSLMEFEAQLVLLFVGGAGISYAISILTFYATANINFRLVWSVRGTKELELLKSYTLNCDIDLYVTGSPSDLPGDPEQEDRLMENIELGDMQPALSFKYSSGRPRLSDFQVPDLLIACGPETMINDAQQYANTNQVKFIKEFYGY